MKTIFALIFLTNLFISNAYAANETYKLKWIMAHNPTNDLVIDLIKDFSKVVEKKSNGKILVEVIPMSNNEDDRHGLGIKSVLSGDATISQVATFALNTYSPKLETLSLPYLFRDHEHIKKVITGRIGSELMDEVYLNSGKKIKGMAFTYSGGYRVISGSKKIVKVLDFNNSTAGQGTIGGSRAEFFKKLGIKFSKDKILSRSDSINAHISKTIDFEDSELNKIYAMSKDEPKLLNSLKYVTESNHSYYLTMIIINNDFYSKLPKDLRVILEEELKNLAEKERMLSIKQADESKVYLASKGVEFNQFDKSELAKLKKIAKDIQLTYKNSLGRLIDSINKL